MFREFAVTSMMMRTTTRGRRRARSIPSGQPRSLLPRRPSPSILISLIGLSTLVLLVGSLPTTHAQAGTVGNDVVDKLKREKIANVFGTEGSHDVGGEDPLCFASTYNITTDGGDGNDAATTTTTTPSTTISELNDILFDDPETSATLTLLKNCFSGSNFSLTPLNAPSDRKLFAGTTYIFRLELETMLSSIDPALVKKPMKDDDDDDDGSIPIWFRLLFCNALQVGFCHPLLDTREFVDDLDASHTDVVPDDTPENRNDYQQGEVLKAIGKDGIYIASRWVSWRLLPRDLEGDLYSAIVDISIILPQDAGGVYLLLGHAVEFLKTEDVHGPTTAYRIDFGVPAPNLTMTLQNAPTILEITRSFKIAVGVIIGVFSSMALAMVGFIYKYRNHRVMTLAQGGLLGWLAACAFVAITASFLYLPTQDVFCRLRGPLVMIPTTMMAAILVGRLWRVYTTLNNASSMGRSSNKGGGGGRKSRISSVTRSINIVSEQRIMQWLGVLAFSRICRRNTDPRSSRQRRASFRQQTTREDTIRLILVLSLPQIILQVFEAVYFDTNVEIEYDDTEEVGRYRCNGSSNRWSLYVGMTVLAVTYILAILVAWYSRDLPTAFNEKDQIFQVATINGIVCMVGIGLMFATDLPTTSPNVTSFIGISVTIAITMVSSWLLVMPKIRRVWSGEKVVISNMLRRMDHGEHLQSSASEATDTITEEPKSSRSPRASAARFSGLEPLPLPPSPPPREEKIKLKEAEAMPRSVEKEMYKLSRAIQEINNKSLQGRPIDMSEWRHLKTSAAALSAQVNRIEFDWSSDVEVDDESDHDVGDDGSFDEGKQAGDGVEHADEESPAGGAV